MKVIDVAGLSADELTQVEREVADHCSLADVLTWSEQQPTGALLAGVIEAVVIQDEFTHDVIVPWRDALVLVYDTT